MPFSKKQAKNGAKNAKKRTSNPQNIYTQTAKEKEAEVKKCEEANWKCTLIY
jgi:hypothetical protein